MATRFAGYPTALIYDAPGGKAIKQLLWGDYVSAGEDASHPGWVPVRMRGTGGWMQADDLSEERLLEVVFVDIGQGDGAMIVTPDDRHLLVDAGIEDNLYRFLRWRYGGLDQPFDFEAVVISHSDEDHYGGFRPIFDDPDVRIGTLFHNGIVERAGDDTLGPRAGGYLTDIITTREELETLLAPPAARGRKKYPNLLHDLLESGRLGDARGLCSADRYLPGFEPGNGPVTIEVLGPVRDVSEAGAPLLKWFEDNGKTKNGHSVVLRLLIGNVSILLGGDLNIPAENHLLSKYTGYRVPPDEADRQAVIEGARRIFRSDVAKACHHGSADFTDLFLQSVDPLVTVISSGDDEPHSHPRADSLGAVGRWGRGTRPLVFSTELARSTRDVITRPFMFRKELVEAQAELAVAPEGAARERAQARVDKLLGEIGRSVAVYGAINLRTDGKRIVMAQKVESPSRVTGQWDVYPIEPDAMGTLRYRSKHD